MITIDQPTSRKVPLGLALKQPDPREATLICKRLHGGSVALCGCRLPLGTDGKGGWLPCPPQARRVLPKQAAVELVVERQAAHLMPVAISPKPAAAAGRLTGDICHNCGGTNMRRTGTCMTCDDCYDSSGGCS